MSFLATGGCLCQCTCGSQSSQLVAQPGDRVFCGGAPAATVMDYAPFRNIQPFGQCGSSDNPAVAAASASGRFAPQACTPAISHSWTPGSRSLWIGGRQALTVDSTTRCAYGGVIRIVNPAQYSCQVQ